MLLYCSSSKGANELENESLNKISFLLVLAFLFSKVTIGFVSYKTILYESIEPNSLMSYTPDFLYLFVKSS